MEYRAVNFKDKLAKFDDYWAPRVIAELNDNQFKVVKIRGEFVWHSHADTDEAFIVLGGRMAIDFRDGRVELAEGEMFVVRKGVKHRPRAQQECQVLVVEPRGVVNTGNAGGRLTAKNDIWV